MAKYDLALGVSIQARSSVGPNPGPRLGQVSSVWAGGRDRRLFEEVGSPFSEADPGQKETVSEVKAVGRDKTEAGSSEECGRGLRSNCLRLAVSFG